ncbi:PREDICTED: alpha-1D adrenergic receptor-like [Priapulus caudatus]|uniref:Alpha-1D adrenergic receptor-like n=1 Tax=Priapulus caudatus TaxID=37621 RepID=A0ABM1EIX6_PRICU|nr:PREDICTED: alpha-1D adrenergic receptor-like [Priapulus caudatus]
MAAGFWPLGYTGCAVWLITDGVFTSATIYIVFTISVDRVMSVTRPLHYRTAVTKATVAVVVVPWLLAAGFPVPVYAGEQIPEYTCRADWVNHQAALQVYTIVLFYAPLIVITICCARIAAAVLSRSKMKPGGATVAPSDVDNGTVSGVGVFVVSTTHAGQAATGPGVSSVASSVTEGERERSRKAAKALRREQVVAMTMCLIVFSFICCWCPWSFYLAMISYNPAFFSQAIFNFVWAMPYHNSLLDPILYNVTNAEFRKKFIKLVCFWK